MKLQARGHSYTFPRPALVMGILNVTPDSFSDGGRFPDSTQALDEAEKLVAEGADILDIGGESTRPGAEPVPVEEEIRRVLPVVGALAGRVAIPISIDTMKPAVARACLDAGASIINDVAANRADPEMWRLAGETGAGYVVMHMQGTPRTMQRDPVYEDLAGEINRFFQDRLERLQEAGVALDQVMLDVGLGFGKTLSHNLQLLACWNSFTSWKRPLLLGASRKSFIGQITGVPQPDQRLAGSLACACWAARESVQIVRTHDVAATRQALRMTEAIATHSHHGNMDRHPGCS